MWFILACALPPAEKPEDTAAVDSADTAPAPAADEICNGLDDDGDGEVDEDAADGGAWYPDADGDGWGADAAVVACEGPSGFVELDGDCDDGDVTAHPGGVEVCDGVDQDCDGEADDGQGLAGCEDQWTDADGDGVGGGDPSCACPGTGVDVGGDCDDRDPATVDGCGGTPTGEGLVGTIVGTVADERAGADLLVSVDAGGWDGAFVGMNGLLVEAPTGGEVVRLEDESLLDLGDTVLFADLDGDGVDDAVAHTSTLTGREECDLYGATIDEIATRHGPFAGSVEASSVASDFVSNPNENIVSVDLVGDVDADGSPDLLWSEAADCRWMAGVWKVPLSGSTTEPGAAAYESSMLEGTRGGDLDGDGVDDLVISSPTALDLYFGPVGWDQASPDAHLQDTVFYLSPLVGDFDGDGAAELVAVRNTEVVVATGPYADGDLDDFALANITMTSGDTLYAPAAGDADGDGDDDLVVTAPSYAGVGGAFVFAGSVRGTLDETTCDRAWLGTADGFGLSAAFVDGADGPLIVVGAPANDTAASDGGAAFVFSMR